LRVYDSQPGSPKKAGHVSKKAKINHIAVLRHAGYTYSKTCINKQKQILKLVRNIDKMQFRFL